MDSLFWADQKAGEIAAKVKYSYLDKTFKRKKYVVKTSASISGALHIGRLSDTIRSETVVRALRDAGYESELIWVAEDMDPLRKIPEGVPKSFEEHIGRPVSTIPDPWECHSSYAEHHVEEYKKVLDEFVTVKPRRYSMQDEYKRGNFKKYIKAMLERRSEVIEIQNKYREHPLPKDWLPWTPMCDNCGKIITPRVNVIDTEVHYVCQDYKFENSVAKGCGHEGSKDPLSGEGKLMWKGEWAAEWSRWDVAAEGAGKEYVVPTSAWWINSEIAERILDHPAPTPIFYEHIMIEGTKMSASLGNIVYPREWLEVAKPELLRFLYNKKLMKTRSFSWSDLNNLFEEYNFYAMVYHGIEKVKDDKIANQMKKLFAISQLTKIDLPLKLSYNYAAQLSLKADQKLKEDIDGIIGILSQDNPNYQNFVNSLDDATRENLRKDYLLTISYARVWKKYAHENLLEVLDEFDRYEKIKEKKYTPEELLKTFEKDSESITQLTTEQKSFLLALAEWLTVDRTSEDIQIEVFKSAKEKGLPTSKAFEAIYLAVLGRKRGPKAGTLLASFDRGWVIERLREVGK